MKKINDIFRMIVEQKKLSTSAMAKVWGTSRQYPNGWLHRRFDFSWYALNRMADYLGYRLTIKVEKLK